MATLIDTAPSKMGTEMGFALMSVAKVTSLLDARGETRLVPRRRDLRSANSLSCC
jgi:hypothetical protein